MLRPDSIKILGAISLDNEFTRAYVSSMKEYRKTFKPITNTNVIEEQISSQIYEYPKNIIKPTNTVETSNKKRRTRRKNIDS